MSVTDRPVRASGDDIELLQKIAEYLEQHGPAPQSEAPDGAGRPAILVDNETKQELRIPSSLFNVVSEAVDILLEGGAVAIMPYHAQLTTQQAADYLGVSRPHLVSLVEAGEIPFTRLRSHRRILLKDLEDYRLTRDEKRRNALADLSRETYELGLYGLPDEGDDTEVGSSGE